MNNDKLLKINYCGIYCDMQTKPTDFTWSNEPNPHHVRVRQIMKQHPDVKELIGKNPYTIFLIFGLVGLQTAIAYGVSICPGGW